MTQRNTKITSVDQLAALTQKEFLATGHRFDGLEGRMDRLENKVDTGFKAVIDTLDIMRADLHDVKVTLGPLVRTVASLEETVRYLDK